MMNKANKTRQLLVHIPLLPLVLTNTRMHARSARSALSVFLYSSSPPFSHHILVSTRRYRHTRGRDDGDVLSLKTLGPPLVDVVLGPGDTLYVPRGCIHGTSTPAVGEVDKADEADEAGEAGETGADPHDIRESSMHLTVGMEAMWDSGLSATWEGKKDTSKRPNEVPN